MLQSSNTCETDMSDVPLQRRLKVIVTHINHPSSFFAQLGTGMMHRGYKIRNTYYKGYLILIYIRVCYSMY